MKHAKTLGLLVVTTAALAAFAGTATGTITSPAGTNFNGTLEATSTNIEVDATIKMKCQKAALAATISGGATNGPVTNLSFSECGADTVSTLKKGTLSIASNGAVTLSGAELTWVWHKTFLGSPLTTHCIYTFGGLGTLTEGANPPVIDLGSSFLTRVATDSFCGDKAGLTGSLTITNPAGPITVD